MAGVRQWAYSIMYIILPNNSLPVDLHLFGMIDCPDFSLAP